MRIACGSRSFCSSACPAKHSHRRAMLEHWLSKQTCTAKASTFSKCHSCWMEKQVRSLKTIIAMWQNLATRTDLRSGTHCHAHQHIVSAPLLVLTTGSHKLSGELRLFRHFFFLTTTNQTIPPCGRRRRRLNLITTTTRTTTLAVITMLLLLLPFLPLVPNGRQPCKNWRLVWMCRPRVFKTNGTTCHHWNNNNDNNNNNEQWCNNKGTCNNKKKTTEYNALVGMSISLVYVVLPNALANELGVYIQNAHTHIHNTTALPLLQQFRCYPIPLNCCVVFKVSKLPWRIYKPLVPTW